MDVRALLSWQAYRTSGFAAMFVCPHRTVEPTYALMNGLVNSCSCRVWLIVAEYFFAMSVLRLACCFVPAGCQQQELFVQLTLQEFTSSDTRHLSATFAVHACGMLGSRSGQTAAIFSRVFSPVSSLAVH